MEKEPMSYYEIIDTIGLGKHQRLTILLTFLILGIQGMMVTINNSMIIPLQNYFNVTDYGFALYSAIFYMSHAFGSFSISFFLMFTSREKLVKLSIVLVSVFSLLGVYLNSFSTFCIFHSFISFGTGLIIPLYLNILCETLPVKYRDYTINTIWVGYSIGSLLINIAIEVVMPDYKCTKSQVILALGFLYVFISSVVCSLLFEDSPRNLVVTCRTREAKVILASMLDERGVVLDERAKTIIMKHYKKGNDRKYASIMDTLSIIFLRKYLLQTLILIFLRLLIALVNDGYSLIFPLIAIDLGKSDSSINFSNILSSGMSVLVQIFVTALIQKFGLKIFTIFVTACFTIFGVLTLIFKSQILIWNPLINSFLDASLYVLPAFVSTTYPTKIRDSVSGIFFFISGIGTLISQIIFIVFLHLNSLAPILFLVVSGAVSVVLSLFIKDNSNDDID